MKITTKTFQVIEYDMDDIQDMQGYTGWGYVSFTLPEDIVEASESWPEIYVPTTACSKGTFSISCGSTQSWNWPVQIIIPSERIHHNGLAPRKDAPEEWAAWDKVRERLGK